MGDFLFLQEVFVSSLFLLLILLVTCHHIDSHLSKLCFFLRKKLIVLMRRNISPSPGVFQPSFLFCGLFLVFLLKRKRNELSWKSMSVQAFFSVINSINSRSVFWIPKAVFPKKSINSIQIFIVLLGGLSFSFSGLFSGFVWMVMYSISVINIINNSTKLDRNALQEAETNNP